MRVRQMDFVKAWGAHGPCKDWVSKSDAVGSLAGKQEGLGVGAATADFEGTEVLVPIPFRHFRLGINPETKFIEVIETDCAVAHAVDQVLTHAWRQTVRGRDPWR